MLLLTDFPLATKSVTLGDLTRRNDRYFAILYTECVTSESYNYVKLISARTTLFPVKCSPKHRVFSVCDLWRNWQRLSRTSALTRDTPLSKDGLTNTAR